MQGIFLGTRLAISAEWFQILIQLKRGRNWLWFDLKWQIVFVVTVAIINRGGSHGKSLFGALGGSGLCRLAIVHLGFNQFLMVKQNWTMRWICTDFQFSLKYLDSDVSLRWSRKWKWMLWCPTMVWRIILPPKVFRSYTHRFHAFFQIILMFNFDDAFLST